MSTLQSYIPPDVFATPPEAASDPFFYGFRHQREMLPDGTSRLVNVPLTRWDVLHPQEGDHIMNGDLHDWLRTYLRTTLETHLAKDPMTKVFSDCGIYWDTPGLDHHCPDVAVVFGIPRDQERSSYSVAEEGVLPWLVMELVSPSTRSSDWGDKVREYYQAGVPTYVILDRQGFGGRWSLHGMKRGRGKYQPMALDGRGFLWLDKLKLWLGLEENRLYCYDEAGKRYDGATADRERADAQQARADAQQARADAEKQRADALSQRIQELEAALKRGNP